MGRNALPIRDSKFEYSRCSVLRQLLFPYSLWTIGIESECILFLHTYLLSLIYILLLKLRCYMLCIFGAYAGFRKITYPVSIEGNLCKCKPHLFSEVLLNSCSAVYVPLTLHHHCNKITFCTANILVTLRDKLFWESCWAALVSNWQPP